MYCSFVRTCAVDSVQETQYLKKKCLKKKINKAFVKKKPELLPYKKVRHLIHNNIKIYPSYPIKVTSNGKLCRVEKKKNRLLIQPFQLGCA